MPLCVVPPVQAHRTQFTAQSIRGALVFAPGVTDRLIIGHCFPAPVYSFPRDFPALMISAARAPVFRHLVYARRRPLALTRTARLRRLVLSHFGLRNVPLQRPRGAAGSRRRNDSFTKPGLRTRMESSARALPLWRLPLRLRLSQRVPPAAVASRGRQSRYADETAAAGRDGRRSTPTPDVRHAPRVAKTLSTRAAARSRDRHGETCWCDVPRAPTLRPASHKLPLPTTSASPALGWSTHIDASSVSPRRGVHAATCSPSLARLDTCVEDG